jgi:hypothetical protein
MNQIAVGDAAAGWLVLFGPSAESPFKGASFAPIFSSSRMVADRLTLSLEGTPQQISDGLAALEKVQERAALYQGAGCTSPQYLRCQPSPSGEFYLTPITDLQLEFNAEGYETHQTGSLRVTLHFTRPNHFDSEPIELPLSNRNGSKVTGGIALVNHTDAHAGHDSSVLIDPADFESPLPAPLRFELENTSALGVLKDILVGLYHHPTFSDDGVFFLQAPEYMGGDLLYSPDAINEYFRRLSWSGTGWTGLGSWTLNNEHVRRLSGRSYRPILHFFSGHGYDDLYLKIKLQKGAYILWEGESVYAHPSYQYLLFPPLRIPPHRLLGEGIPHHVDLVIYGQHEGGGTYQLEFDQLHLLPLDGSASFLGFYDMLQDDILVDDSFRGLYNVQYATLGSEAVGHLRQGGPLVITPGEYNRLFFVLVNENHQVDIMRTASLRAYYRRRVRIL